MSNFCEPCHIIALLQPFYFLGPYEIGSKYGSGYKHVFFNSNYATSKLWMITVAEIILLYEATKYAAYVTFIGNLKKYYFFIDLCICKNMNICV